MTKATKFFYILKRIQIVDLATKMRMALKQKEGSAAVEFGIVAPIFLALLIGMYDVGMMLVAHNALDAAASRAGQFGLSGRASPGMTRNEAIEQAAKDAVQAYSGGILDPDKVTISVSAYNDLTAVGKPEPLINDVDGDGDWDAGDSYLDINNNGQWDADQGKTSSFGLPGQAVRYEINYDWQPIYKFFGNKDPIRLRGISPIVNEDFPSN
ncbi:MAG: TadE/TadG family type IV pilus assembly protein [Pseudomonadota bacterium]